MRKRRRNRRPRIRGGRKFPVLKRYLDQNGLEVRQSGPEFRIVKIVDGEEQVILFKAGSHQELQDWVKLTNPDLS